MDPTNLIEHDRDHNPKTAAELASLKKSTITGAVLAILAILCIIISVIFTLVTYFLNDEKKYNLSIWPEVNDETAMNYILSQEASIAESLKYHFQKVDLSPNRNLWNPIVKELLFQLKATKGISKISFASKDNFYLAVEPVSKGYSLEYYQNGQLFTKVSLDTNGNYVLNATGFTPSSLNDLVLWNSFTESSSASKWNFMAVGDSNLHFLEATATTGVYSSIQKLEYLITVTYYCPTFTMIINRPPTLNSKFYLMTPDLSLVEAYGEDSIVKKEFGLARKSLLTSDFPDIKELGKYLNKHLPIKRTDYTGALFTADESGRDYRVTVEVLDNSWYLMHLIAVDDYEYQLTKYFTVVTFLVSIVAGFIVACVMGVQLNIFKTHVSKK